MIEQKTTTQPGMICPSCKNEQKDSLCHICGGVGYLRSYEGFTLFWGKRLDVWHVAYDRLTEQVQKVWLLLLVLLSIIGKLFIIWYIIRTLSFPAVPYANIWYGSIDYRIAFGWISLAIDTYIFYFLTTTVESRKKLSKLKKRQENNEVISKRVNIAHYTNETGLRVVEKGWEMADKYDQASYEPFHLFAALLDAPTIKTLFARIGISYNELSKILARQLAKRKLTEKHSVEISKDLREIFSEALIYSYQENKEYVDPTSLLYAIAKHDLLIQEILYDLNVDVDKLSNVVQWADVRTKIVDQYKRFRLSTNYKPIGAMDRAMTAVATPLLDRYSTDLTRLAVQGYLDLTIGREDEFKQLFRLIESGKTGVVLVGPQGVGKTSMLHGLAQFMVEERVPKQLQDKRLVNLDAARLVSGATAAIAAERLIQIADEVTRAGNIVLTIENVNSLIGISTGSEQSMDLVDVLGSVIGRRRFPVIATSEPLAYSAKTSLQATLGQIFKILEIKEPEENLAIRILEAKTMTLEYKHKVFFLYDAITELIKLSYRYLPEEYMPAKAIGLLEEIALYKAKNTTDKDDLIIRVDDVATIVSERIRIPVSKVSKKESDVLLNMERLIHLQMIDQEQAVVAVSEALRRARAELTTGERPIANFLFLGPTGVGKTQLAKTVADIYFGSEENMIRLDMSEYQDASAVNKLIGSEGATGNLTRTVAKQPFSILLLDELEKAHPDILNLFLQVMDDGRLTDGTGRTIDFTNLIIIATSNAGSQFIEDAIKKQVDAKKISSDLLAGELRNFFKPEFLNRFDGVIVFKPLSSDDVFQIAKLMVHTVAKQLEEKHGVVLEVTPDALRELAQAGYKPEFGARPMRRVIQDKLDTPIATLILKEKVQRRDTIRVTRRGVSLVKRTEL